MAINPCVIGVFVDIVVLKHPFPNYVGASLLVKELRGVRVKCVFAILRLLGVRHGNGLAVVGVVEEEGEEEEEHDVEGGRADCEGE